MSSRNKATGTFRFALLGALIAFQCAAAGPPAQQQARPQTEAAQPAARRAALQSTNLPSSVLGGGGVQTKIKVTSTDAQGNCPNGGTKLDKCSGVYPNGNSWEISPCCRIETN